MLEMELAMVNAMSRWGEAVEPLPESTELGLPPRTAHLRVVKASVQDAHIPVAGGTDLQQTILWLALDVMRWSEEKQAPGGTWVHALAAEHLNGLRKFELAAVEGKGRDREVVIASTVEGEFQGLDQQSAQLESATSKLRWSLEENCLLTLESTVRVRYGDETPDRDLTTTVELRRIDHRKLEAEAQEQARGQLEELAGITDQLTRGDRPAAIPSLKAFLEKHPESLWLPVAQDLFVKSKYQAEKLGSMSTEQLVSVLVQLVAKWQSIAVNETPERLEPLRTAYAELADIQRDTLLKLIKDEDSSVRAISIFCLGFSSQAEDLALIQAATADEDPRVRAWATYALAERGSSDTDLKILQRLLGDADANVRQRACMAVQACIPAGSREASRFAEALLNLVADDSEMTVRYFAAAALIHLADGSILPRLRKLHAGESEESVKNQISIVIRKLEAETAGRE
jgi:HEAT repeat protein